MAYAANNSDSLAASAATAPPSMAENTPHTAKRNQRHRKNHHHPHNQSDGTLSDSVINSLSTPQSKKAPKQRHQSVAIGAPIPTHSAAPHPGMPTHPNASQHNQRPASHGGNMLPNTPLKEAAYAGPTFQASPAPSSLPVPKFFSRSVPNVAAQSSLTARMEGRLAEEHEEQRSSPEPDMVNATRNGQKSPLDMFFNADRQEREKSRSSSNLSPELPKKHNIGPQQTEGSNFGGRSSMTPPAGHGNPQNHQTVYSHATTPTGIQNPENGADRDAQTAALKALLFNNINSPPSHSPPQSITPPYSNQQPALPNSGAPGQNYGTPSPVQGRSTSGPSTPTPSSEQQRQSAAHYALHYGNQRNLSPLFKAASSTRADTPPSRGPSGLRRQELASELPSHPYPSQPIDPNSFSRGYLEQHVREAGVTSLPSLPVTNGHPNRPDPPQFAFLPSAHNSETTGGRPSPGTLPHKSNGAGNSADTSNDIKGMENDLRRMLNLNVMSN